MTRLLGAFALLASVGIACSAFVACGGDDPQIVKPQKVGSSSGDGDDDDDTTGALDAGSSSSSSSSSGSVIDAATGGSAVTYRGTVAKTPTSQFGGGSGHCTYNVAMSAIEIELAITPDGNVIGGTAKNNMTETLVGACAFAAIGTKPMSFAFASATGQTLTWAGAGTNGPKTNLTITLTKTGDGYQAAAKWVRADRTDDLQWNVSTTVTLDPK